MKPPASTQKTPGLFSLLKSYKIQLIKLCAFVLVSSALNLVIPKLVSVSIDNFSSGKFIMMTFIIQFSILALAIFTISTAQGIFSNYLAEKVAFDLREKIASRISKQSYSFINVINPSTLLTNLTSDVDGVKSSIAQAVPILFSSVLLILGSAAILLSINWQLALGVLGIISLLIVMFKVVFGKSSHLFKLSQEALDKLNKVINESIIASPLIRVVTGQYKEIIKFNDAAVGAKEVNLKILAFFASLIPMITFFSNLAVIVVLYFGGNKVINNSLSLGEFTAFYGYISILILPVILIGFISNVVVRASTSYKRISKVLEAPLERSSGTLRTAFEKQIEFQKVNLTVHQKKILKDLSFSIKFAEKTALIGPTGGGKTLLLYILSGLIRPTEGAVIIDGKPLEEYDPDFLRSNIGVVFQDSIIFNGTVRENICFNQKIADNIFQKALETSALDQYVKELPNGAETMITERGASLSGGQKQRISLARALVLEPRVLLLDDFTARVDLNTEKLIFSRLQKNYPNTMLLAVSQKISTVKDFNHLILLMEGELLAEGSHEELLKNSFEYRQIFASQQTT